MSDLKSLKTRIGSVKNTQKITKAMKMVAASRLRKSQEAAENARPYSKAIEEILASVAASAKDQDNAPELLIGRKDGKKHLLIVATSDRGLCGNFNSVILKAARNKVEELEKQGKEVSLFALGKKAIDLLKSTHANKIVKKQADITKKPLNFSVAENIAGEILEMFAKGEFDSCGIFYNKFISAITKETTYQQLIPLDLGTLEGDKDKPATIYEFEPDETQILSELLPKNIAVQTYYALLENAASEHAARMTAMDNSTRNAGDMIYKLTLQYNRTRQAAITKELIEIISGAEAV